MSLFWRIILGLIVALVGFLMIYKTRTFQGITGRIAWAEDKLGGGGTYTFLKILGLLVIFLGIFIVSGIIDDILKAFANMFVR